MNALGRTRNASFREHRVQDDEQVQIKAMELHRKALFGFPVDFHLDVVIGFRFVAAVTEQPNVARLHAFGVDQLPFGGFDVAQILADPQPRRVDAVVVEDRADIIDKVRIATMSTTTLAYDRGSFRSAKRRSR